MLSYIVILIAKAYPQEDALGLSQGRLRGPEKRPQPFAQSSDSPAIRAAVGDGIWRK
jgi:hypothetical protein